MKVEGFCRLFLKKFFWECFTETAEWQMVDTIPSSSGDWLDDVISQNFATNLQIINSLKVIIPYYFWTSSE
jgi:hypothetical protein